MFGKKQTKAILDRIAEMETKIMSEITDWAATEEADLSAISATLDGIATGVTALDALIQSLKSGGLSPTDKAALDVAKAASAALVTKAAAISTAPPV